MTGTSDDASSWSMPDVVVVGAAARDLDDTDARGWRLGGGVTYGALACARLGLRTGVVLGVDALAAAAHEIDLLDAAGARVVRVPLTAGPVFHNEERPGGRVQTCHSVSAPIPTRALPDGWRASRAWMLSPVAGELPEAWASVPVRDATVAFGWQGILRRMAVGERVSRTRPVSSALVTRADIVGASRFDMPRDTLVGTLLGVMRPDALLLLSAGELGGLLLRTDAGGGMGGRRYPALTPAREVDATGAGDVTLATFLGARVLLRDVTAGRDLDQRSLRVAATAGSLTVERAGLDAVPTRQQIEERLRT